jgi:hypothetical protein
MPIPTQELVRRLLEAPLEFRLALVRQEGDGRIVNAGGFMHEPLTVAPDIEPLVLDGGALWHCDSAAWLKAACEVLGPRATARLDYWKWCLCVAPVSDDDPIYESTCPVNCALRAVEGHRE